MSLYDLSTIIVCDSFEDMQYALEKINKLNP